MQRESARRGFFIQHQKVALNIDLAGHVRGYTEITIVPNLSTLRTIHLHSRECDIHSISVAGETADYVLQDYFSSLGPSKADDVHSFPEIKRKLFTALADSDEGALSIAIPSSQLPVRLSTTREPTLSPAGFRATESESTSQFAPITILIHYSLRNPRDGIQFVLPTDAYPYVSPMLFSRFGYILNRSTNLACSPRVYIPCEP